MNGKNRLIGNVGIPAMDKKTIKYMRKRLGRENDRWTSVMQDVPRSEWPYDVAMLARSPSQVWRSSEYLAQVFMLPGTAVRISVCRAAIADDGRYQDGLTWDQLMQIKREIGFGNHWAVEIFPPTDEVVNVANMRHLWILTEPPPYAWRRNSP